MNEKIAIAIRPWTAVDRDEVIDLADVDAGYRASGGEFLVAHATGDGADRVVGTIAAIVIEDNTVAVRTLFVHRDHRGEGLAARLMEALVQWARQAGYRTMLLGTTDVMTAAHRFSEKHGFTRMSAEALPIEFPRMAADSIFFRRDLPGVVNIREYDPRWPDVFEQERQRIEVALAGLAIGVHHCGSTSVPDLPAKPIIDIVMSVPDSTDEDAYVARLGEVGYSLTLREPDWFEHRLLNRDWPRVNLHVFSTGADEVDRMLQFRDHLRSDTADRRLYALVKRELAARDWDIVQDYADSKTEVVTDIMTRAR